MLKVVVYTLSMLQDEYLLQCEMDPETGEAKDELLPEAKALIAKLGSSCTKVSEVLASKDEKVYSEITAGLESVNKNAISNAQKVKCQCYCLVF